MTVAEWSAGILEDLVAAGFVAELYHGFPLVRTSIDTSIADREKLLELTVRHPVERTIYAEGMLFLPAGAWRLRR